MGRAMTEGGERSSWVVAIEESNALRDPLGSKFHDTRSRTLRPLSGIRSATIRQSSVGSPSQPSRRLRPVFDAGPLSPGFMLGLFFDVCLGRVLAGDGRRRKIAGQGRFHNLETINAWPKAWREPAEACSPFLLGRLS
jgi:hypothetical protein